MPRFARSLDGSGTTPPSLRRPRTESAEASIALLQAYLRIENILAGHGVHVRRFFAANGQALYGAEYDSEYDTATNRTVLVWRRQAPVGQATEVLRPGDPGYLTAGERGYLASMRRLLRMIRRSPRLERVLVMDDDVRFHCQLSSKLAALLEEPRCDGSGVLLLGVRATPAVPHATISRTPTARPLPRRTPAITSPAPTVAHCSSRLQAAIFSQGSLRPRGRRGSCRALELDSGGRAAAQSGGTATPPPLEQPNPTTKPNPTNQPNPATTQPNKSTILKLGPPTGTSLDSAMPQAGAWTGACPGN